MLFRNSAVLTCTNQTLGIDAETRAHTPKELIMGAVVLFTGFQSILTSVRL